MKHESETVEISSRVKANGVPKTKTGKSSDKKWDVSLTQVATDDNGKIDLVQDIIVSKIKNR